MNSLAECRVCGKAYKPCRSEIQSGVFRWQAVACSPECGAEYLRRIEESRVPKQADSKVKRGKRSPFIADDAEAVAEDAPTG